MLPDALKGRTRLFTMIAISALLAALWMISASDVGATAIQQAKLIAPDSSAGDRFGGSVSVDGDTALVGAVSDDDGGTSSGSAYVFVRTGTTWSQQAKLTSSDAAASDQLGFSVAIDGDTALVAAAGDNSF